MCHTEGKVFKKLETDGCNTIVLYQRLKFKVFQYVFSVSPVVSSIRQIMYDLFGIFHFTKSNSVFIEDEYSLKGKSFSGNHAFVWKSRKVLWEEIS